MSVHVPGPKEVAQARIEQILAELERSTGQLVKSIDIRSRDITELHEAVPKRLHSISIELYSIPRVRWEA